MQFRVFLRCCLKCRSDNETKHEIVTKKAESTSKDNSNDKSENDTPNKNKEEIEQLQQSQPIPEDFIKATISQADPTKPKANSGVVQQTKEESKDIIKGGTITPINYEDFTIITDEINQKGAQLTLKIIESNVLMKESIISITPFGYKDSKRHAKDGKTFFGTVLEGKSQNQNEPYINDFVLPIEENGFGKRHFMIQYSPSIHIIRG